MKNHFDISGRIEIREVDIAGVACNSIWDVVVYENKKKQNKKKTNRSIRESPRNCPFMKINGNEAPKGPSPINFQEWTDTRTFSDLKYN